MQHTAYLAYRWGHIHTRPPVVAVVIATFATQRCIHSTGCRRRLRTTWADLLMCATTIYCTTRDSQAGIASMNHHRLAYQLVDCKHTILSNLPSDRSGAMFS